MIYNIPVQAWVAIAAVLSATALFTVMFAYFRKGFYSMPKIAIAGAGRAGKSIVASCIGKPCKINALSDMHVKRYFIFRGRMIPIIECPPDAHKIMGNPSSVPVFAFDVSPSAPACSEQESMCSDFLDRASGNKAIFVCNADKDADKTMLNRFRSNNMGIIEISPDEKAGIEALKSEIKKALTLKLIRYK